jgi:hypothetical protein
MSIVEEFGLIPMTAERHPSLETWQRLQARLGHLGHLGEDLAEVVATSPATSAWLYRHITAEADEVIRIAGDYITETEQAGGAL